MKSKIHVSKTINILKWTGITLAAAAVLTLAYIHGKAWYVFNKTYDIPLVEITVPTDSASIAEGFRQVKLLHCEGCHGDGLMGKVMKEGPGFGRLVSANVPKAIQGYTDSEIYRVLRHGINKEGKISFPMPAMSQYHLKDESLAQIIAYLRTLDAVENNPPLPPSFLSFRRKKIFAFNENVPAPAKMDHNAPRISANFGNDPIAHGNYLTKTLCSHCHGPNLEGEAWRKSPGLNIIFMYDREQFHRLMRTGEGASRKEVGEMSEVATRFMKYLTDEEVDAIYDFLKSRLEEDGTAASVGAE